MEAICQSCGMNMVKTSDFGTNKDSSLNKEYCCYCYTNGSFTKDYTMEEMINNNLKHLDEFNNDSHTNFDKEQAKAEMMKFFPQLKRWRK